MTLKNLEGTIFHKPAVEVRIANAVLEIPDVSPVAKEKAGPLVSAFVEKYFENDAANLTPLQVEQELVVELSVAADKPVYLAGRPDLLFQTDGSRVESCYGVGEWKTSSGRESAEQWEGKAHYSNQARLYLWMARKLGIIPEGKRLCYISRAVTKDPSPRHYTTDVVQVSEEELSHLYTSVYHKIEYILHLMKLNSKGPWHKNQPHECYRWGMKYVCGYRPICDGGEQPPTLVPAVPHLEIQKEDAYVFTHSTLEQFQACEEQYRLNGLVGIAEPPNMAQQIGVVFHHGVAEMYRIIKEG